MLRLAGGDTLSFSFPQVHKDAKLRIQFMRTLRVPDDGRDNCLPSGLGTFPMEHVEDYEDKVPAQWVKEKGALVSAKWVDFLAQWFDGLPKWVEISRG